MKILDFNSSYYNHFKRLKDTNDIRESYIHILEDVECIGTFNFDNIRIDANSWYDDEPFKPYMVLEGSVKNIVRSDDYDLDDNYLNSVLSTSMNYSESPYVTYRYDFTPEEISDLVLKGLYTRNFSAPAIFKNSDFRIPFNLDFLIVENEERPLVFANSKNNYLNLNFDYDSSGYRLADYFDNFYDKDVVDSISKDSFRYYNFDRSDIFANEKLREIENIIKEENLDIENYKGDVKLSNYEEIFRKIKETLSKDDESIVRPENVKEVLAKLEVSSLDEATKQDIIDVIRSSDDKVKELTERINKLEEEEKSSDKPLGKTLVETDYDAKTSEMEVDDKADLDPKMPSGIIDNPIDENTKISNESESKKEIQKEDTKEEIKKEQEEFEKESEEEAKEEIKETEVKEHEDVVDNEVLENEEHYDEDKFTKAEPDQELGL